jgi:hypothetical protein
MAPRAAVPMASAVVLKVIKHVDQMNVAAAKDCQRTR